MKLTKFYKGVELTPKHIQALNDNKCCFVVGIKNKNTGKRHDEIIYPDENNVNPSGFTQFQALAIFSPDVKNMFTDGDGFDVKPSYLQKFVTENNNGLKYQSAEVYKIVTPVITAAEISDTKAYKDAVTFAARVYTKTCDSNLSREWDKGNSVSIYLHEGYDELAESMVNNGRITISTDSATNLQDYCKFSVTYNEAEALQHFAGNHIARTYSDAMRYQIDEHLNINDKAMAEVLISDLAKHNDRVMEEAERLGLPDKSEGNRRPSKSSDRIYKTPERELVAGVDYPEGDLSDYEELIPYD